ncbi:hypothetical protein N177_2155 [Lutibaculum baratangense AMV1]|uniref:Uncharacterized protein n=1 Tax=Lutibaculum baratangense AMV1 TaxID=631454 RepID=V4QYK3_9HYPH|nr:hypothetical protein N177_2155 [Lutibaculum baratangense AMV1]
MHPPATRGASLYAAQHSQEKEMRVPPRVLGIDRFSDRLKALGLFAVLVAPFLLARI